MKKKRENYFLNKNIMGLLGNQKPVPEIKFEVNNGELTKEIGTPNTYKDTENSILKTIFQKIGDALLYSSDKKILERQEEINSKHDKLGRLEELYHNMDYSSWTDEEKKEIAFRKEQAFKDFVGKK